MENLDENNIEASIQISATEEGIVVGETRGHYSDIIGLLAIAILNLQEETNIPFEEIGKDLNKAVKFVKEQHEEED